MDRKRNVGAAFDGERPAHLETLGDDAAQALVDVLVAVIAGGDEALGQLLALTLRQAGEQHRAGTRLEHREVRAERHRVAHRQGRIDLQDDEDALAVEHREMAALVGGLGQSTHDRQGLVDQAIDRRMLVGQLEQPQRKAVAVGGADR